MRKILNLIFVFVPVVICFWYFGGYRFFKSKKINIINEILISPDGENKIIKVIRSKYLNDTLVSKSNQIDTVKPIRVDTIKSVGEPPIIRKQFKFNLNDN